MSQSHPEYDQFADQARASIEQTMRDAAAQQAQAERLLAGEETDVRAGEL